MELAKSLSRLGTESAFSVLAEAKKLEAQGKPMIHLGLGQPDFKTPKHVVDAAKKALDDGHHGYVLSNGILECRQAVTRWIKKRYSAEVDPERILIMPGGKPTMHYAIQCFGEPGAEIIHPTPAFPIYESMINYTGSTAVPYDLTEDKDLKFSAEKILSLITEKTRLLILINPNNPTGSVLPKQTVEDITSIASNVDAWIISDEVYRGAELNGEECASFWDSGYEKTIVNCGLSKAYALPGLRLGWSLSNPKYIKQSWANHDYTSISVGRLSDLIAAHVLHPNNRMETLNYIRHELAKNLDIFQDWISEFNDHFNFIPPEAGAMAFVKYDWPINSSELIEKIRNEASVMLVAGDWYGMDNFIRFGYGAKRSDLKNALDRITPVFKSL